MPTLETYRKQAKLLVRWHRERNYSVGEKVRQLERHRHRTDSEILALPLPLALAQEIVAFEAGFPDWAALKAASGVQREAPPAVFGEPALAGVVPILFVRDVAAAAAFYEEKLGFQIDFLHGNPAFFAAVSRDRARFYLRFVHRPNFAELSEREGSLILAMVEVGDVKALFQEYESRGVDIPQRLTRHPWGGLDFHVRDPDGNVFSFVQYLRPDPSR